MVWLVVMICGLATGCSHGTSSSEAETRSASDTAPLKKDRMALRQIERTPPACEADRDCITGSHCDAVTSRCKWECIADTDCGPVARCTASGSCVAAPPGAAAGGFTAHSATDSPGCSQVPPDELLRVLGTLNDDQVSCPNGDDGCPCGSFCNNLSGLCEVDCIAGVDAPPASIPGCGDHQACTPLGRCEASSTTPPPPVQALTLQIAPLAISGNSISAPVLVPATVSVTANSLDFLRATQPATVRYHVVTQAGQPPPPPGTVPQVRCAADAPLADHCDVTSWSFRVNSGSLASDPQTIWVQVPQSATPAQWVLEARSDWALTPASAVISAAPVAFPASDPGHYTGTLRWANRGALAGAAPLQVPVEAFVTATHVALYEPSRVLLPDGHAVIARDPSKVTLLGWLAQGSSRYDVGLALAVGAYDSTAGHLDATGSIRSGSLQQTALALALQRTGDVTAASCAGGAACAAGSYCEAAMNLCLPGTGPAAGAGIVTAGAPTTTLASSLMTSWNTALTSLVASNPSLLGGSTPREQLERPYCFQAASQAGPAGFARDTTLLSPSNDLACTIAGADQPQVTFPLENAQQEVGVDSGGNSFNLLDNCVAELDQQPTGAVPGIARCASLSRFLLALRPAQVDDYGYRLKGQLLRQWLGVNAYVANTTVQDQQFEEALGTTGLPPQTRFAQALDRMASNLTLLLDPSARPYYAADGGMATSVARNPDYRFLRPRARYTFNEPLFSLINNVETGQTVPSTFFSCLADGSSYWSVIHIGIPPYPPDPDLPCVESDLSSLTSPAGFSLVFQIRKSANTNRGFFWTFGDPILELSDPGGASKLDVWASGSPTQLVLSVVDPASSFGFPAFSFPALTKPAPSNPLLDPLLGFGLIAIIKRGDVFIVMQAMPNQPVHTFQVSQPPLAFVLPAGKLAFAGQDQNLDELSLWDRPLSVEEFAAMATRYFAGSTGDLVPTNESLPPRPASLSGNEQAAGLPVHMLEAAAAQLNLAQAYVAAERNLVYTQCLAGQRDELAAVVGRVGNSLRTAAVLDDEAAGIVAAVGTTAAWYPRYQADLTQLAGRRAQLISDLAGLQSSECKNPLGISEDDLPLYVGSAGTSAAERFFASSRFLANAALSEVTAAGGETGLDGLLAQARSAYNAARTSQFQEAQGAHDSADRILKINIDYEDQLKRYCGAPGSEDAAHGVFPLLAGFQSGVYTASNCFIKSEQSGCAGLDDTPISALPASCLRGEMGERVLAIQAANVDATNAQHAYERAIDQFGADMGYCARLKQQLDGDEELLRRHIGHMWNLTLEKEAEAGSFMTRIFSIGAAAARGGYAGLGEIVGFGFSVDKQIQEEQNSYELEKQQRGSAEQIMACVQKADDEKFAIDAARDTINRAYEQTRAAALALADASNLVGSIAAEGAGQLAIESSIDRTPPHLHYWLDQTISAYHAHMAYARRLTYLAVRAYEYESQSTSNLRGPVLNALLPNDLKTVASTILGATAPFAGRQVDQGPLVLSLRDDILQIADLSQHSSRLDGSAPLTPVEAFKQLLKSDATRLYDQSGHYVGHGIKFSLNPQPVDAQTCAERISRIMPSVTIENASQEITHTRIILAATNTFGSQLCGPTVPGPLQRARVQPSQAVLVGDTVPTFQTPSAFSTTGLFPLINTPRDTLRNLSFPTDDPSGFAGRGRYGDYILIFPDDPAPCTPSLCDGWSLDALDKVDDVLLRFDTVEQDNTHL